MGKGNYFSNRADNDRAEKERVLHSQKQDDIVFEKATFTLTAEDKRLLAQHRVDTGESASAFIRRMIAQELR